MRGSTLGVVAGLSLVAGVVLADVEVVSTEYVIGEDHPRFHMGIENSSDAAVAVVQYEAVFVTSGRTVPWAKDSGQKLIPGGIEPGETRTIEFDIDSDKLTSIDGYDIDVSIATMAAYDMEGSPLNEDAREFIRKRDEFLRKTEDLLREHDRIQEKARATIEALSEAP